MSENDSSRRIGVALGARSYDVVIGADLISQAGALIVPFSPRGRGVVVADGAVWALHGAALEGSLRAAGIVAPIVTVPPGEASKSWAGLARVCDALAEHRVERGDLVIAFGGGVVGDLAGFAAGVFKRGVDFVQIPTTLLAQVDSSVGGKTAIDIAAGKNLVGLFHQPRLVLADTGVLATLPDRERRAGYAEIVKYALIDDPAFLTWLEANGAAVLRQEPGALVHAVATSVAAKARIVGADERETGARALLNLGHTFAHALETLAGYDGALLHGEAVAIGMAMAFEFSGRIGLCPEADVARVRRALSSAGLETDPRRLPFAASLTPDAVLDLMAQDKKVEGGRLTLILARGVGQAFVAKDAPRTELRAFLADALETTP